MKNASSAHTEVVFDALWQVHCAVAGAQLAVAAASIAMTLEFWSMWQPSLASRAIELIEQSPFGEHLVIHAKFGNQISP